MVKRFTSFTLGAILGAIVKEAFQEVLIDPWIEATVSGLVRRAGGDAFWQATLSTLAESGREALTGIFSSGTGSSQTLIEVLDLQYYEKGLTPSLQNVIEVMQQLTGDINAQQVQAQEDAASLRKAMKAISFVSKAISFSVSMFLGPVAALAYTTLATYCYTEEISLKKVFKKTFNPIKIALSNSKVGDYIRNNKKQILLALGIGVASWGWMALQTLIPALSSFNAFGNLGIGFGGIFIGMVNIKQKDIVSSRTNDEGEITLKVRKIDVLLKASTANWDSRRKLSDLQISIHKYSRIVVDEYIDASIYPLYIKNQPKISTDSQIINDIYGSKNFLRLGDRFYDFALNHREYGALIYELSLKEPLDLLWYDYTVGEYIGLTHSSHLVRFGFHIKDALRAYTKHIVGNRLNLPTKLSTAIIAALKDKGFSDNALKKLYYDFKNSRSITTDKKLWSLIYDLSESHFELKVIELYKDKELAYEREKQLTKERNLVEEGLNMKLGGGARMAAYIFLPLYDIIGLISMGYTMRAITTLMRKHYGIQCHEETVRKRIIEYFGGWDKAQQMFLKPVIEALTYEGYNPLEVFRQLGGSYVESKGWAHKWFIGSHQLDFEFWMDKNYLDTDAIIDFIKNTEEIYYGYSRSQWEKWILEGKSMADISRDTGLTNSMVRSGFKSLGGKIEFIKQYRVRRTIELRKQGWSLKKIYMKEFGFDTTKHIQRDFRKWFKNVFPGFTGDVLKKIEETWSLKNTGNYLG